MTRNPLTNIDTILFDFFGTIAVIDLDPDKALARLIRSLEDQGLRLDHDSFIQSYAVISHRYHEKRYKELIEVTNAVWIVETLGSLGFRIGLDDPILSQAIDAYFQPFLDNTRLRPEVPAMLGALGRFKLGLVSNFTYAPALRAMLEDFRLNIFFQSLTISHEVGYRKPHAEIFKRALETIHADASRTFFIGDTPFDDVFGAKNSGLKSGLLDPTRRYTPEEAYYPDIVLSSLSDLTLLAKGLNP